MFLLYLRTLKEDKRPEELCKPFCCYFNPAIKRVSRAVDNLGQGLAVSRDLDVYSSEVEVLICTSCVT